MRAFGIGLIAVVIILGLASCSEDTVTSDAQVKPDVQVKLDSVLPKDGVVPPKDGAKDGAKEGAAPPADAVVQPDRAVDASSDASPPSG